MSEIAKSRATTKVHTALVKAVGALISGLVALFAFYQLPMSGWSHLLIFVAGIGFCYAWLALTNRKETK